MYKTEGECPGCGVHFTLEFEDKEFKTTIKSGDPEAEKINKINDGDDMMAKRILDHDTHILIIELNKGGTIRTQVTIDKVSRGLDVLVNENVNACRAICSMLQSHPIGYTPRIVFISNPDYFLQFISSQLNLLLLCDDEFFSFEKWKHFLTLDYGNFLYSVSELEHSSPFLISNNNNPVHLKSLVIDTSVYDNDIILKYFKQWNIDLKGIKVILAYNSDNVDNIQPEFDLQTQLYEMYKAETVSLLDVAEVGGRRFVNIEAIIALTMNENIAREYLRRHVPRVISIE